MDKDAFVENIQEHFAAITNSDHLYQKAPCGFISFLPDGSILRVNETLSNWLGYTEREIYELDFKTLLSSEAHLYYQLIVTPLLNIKGYANEIDLNFTGKNRNFDALLNAVAYKNEDGLLVAVNSTIQINTDRKRYEAELLQSKCHAEEEKRKFESLYDTVPNLIWTASPNGQVNFINQRFKDYFDISDLTEINNFKFIFEEDRANLMNSWKTCLKNGRTLNRELRLKAKGKNPEWFLLCAEPYTNSNGVVELWFGSFTNIHKQKLLQLANYSSLSTSLSVAHKIIDVNNETLLKIAYDQSHTIRKPLANILGIVSLLKDIEVTDEIKELLELLHVSAAELDVVVKKVVGRTRPFE